MKNILDYGYKLIVCDFDDTLADSNKQVSEKNQIAIREYMDKGGKFCLCSGRALPSIQQQIEKFNLFGSYMIGCHGSVIADPNGKIIEKRNMPQKKAHATIDTLLHNGVKFMMIYIDNKIYTTISDERTENYTKISGVPITEVFDVKKLIDNHPDGIQKILLIDKPEIILEYYKKIVPLMPEGLQINGSQSNFLEIVDIISTKGQAMLSLCNTLNIDIKNTIAIGDSDIDISMIEMAGLGVCVSNSFDTVKQNSNIIMDYSNNEDALYHLIHCDFIMGR